MKKSNFLLNMIQLIIPFLAVIFISSNIQAQKIQLFDTDENMPIVGATFKYDTQSGVSDESGFISINYVGGEMLFLSHIAYGEWELNDDKVKVAIENGKLFRAAKVGNFQPVTVIALRPKMDEKETVNLGVQDRLAHDGATILNRLPVINSIQKSGAYGFDPVMRGFKYDQLNVVINGAQCATAACPNRMDPPTSQVAPNMMDRVEILKGPHSLRFGNSFGGTINFIPAPPRFSEQSDTYGRISGNYESNGNIMRSEGLLGFSGKKYDLGFFGSWSQGEDYEDGEDVTVPADFLRGSFGTRLGFNISEGQNLILSATRNIARDADFPALPMDLREDDTWLFNAQHELIFDGKKLQSWNTTAYATLVNHLMDNLLKDFDPRMLNASTEAETRSYGGRTEGVWQFGKGKLYGGADLRMEEAEGIRAREFLMGPNAGKTVLDNAWQHGKINRTGLFTEYHLRKNSTRFVFSGRVEMNQASVTDAAEEFTNVYPETDETQINPSLSIGGINNFSNGFSVGLWLGRAQRSGSMTERYINYFPVGLDPYEMLGNPELDPEVNNQVDLTFGFKAKNTLVDVNLFASFLQDYISSEINEDLMPRLPNSPGVRQFVNLDEAFMTGFEVTWNQAFTDNIQHQMSFAYTYGEDRTIDEPLPEIAPLDFRYSLSGNFLNEKLLPEITFRHVLNQERISTVFGETETPSFSLVDVSVGYKFGKYMTLSAGANNLFDEAYFEHLTRSVRGTDRAIYAPGRNVFVSLAFDFM